MINRARTHVAKTGSGGAEVVVARPIAVSPPDITLARSWRWLRSKMNDERGVALLTCMLSIGFFVWYQRHGQILAFNDARIREMIARRVVESRTPGLAQLGTTWLPLPSLLSALLIWNGALFRGGFAGSLPAMLSYVVASVYMYRLGRLMAGSRTAGWVGAAVLMLNPSVLYMQSTAMSEIPSLSAFVVAIYYGARAARSFEATDISKCAAAVAVGTLIRYEDWVLALGFVPVLAYIAWRKQGYSLAEAWIVLYGLLAFAGCAAWVIYNWVIFHDPLLSFFYGQTSHTFYANTPDYLLPARHHPVFAFVMYGLTVAKTVGWLILPVALAGFAVYVWRKRLRASFLPGYLTLLPFLFYWFALYKGANTESLRELGDRQYYNIRFGLAMIPAIALFAAFAVTASERLRVRRGFSAAVLAVVLGTLVVNSTIQKPFVLREALYGAGSDARHTGQVQAAWLSEHYRGGNVLITYVNSPSMMFYLLTEHHFSDRRLITDANGPQFEAALANPARWVNWVVINSDASNGVSRVWEALHRRRDWRRQFVLRKAFQTTQIYERRPLGVLTRGRDAPSRQRERTRLSAAGT